MQRNQIGLAIIALFLGITGMGISTANARPLGAGAEGTGQYGGQANDRGGGQYGGDWDSPPGEMQDIQRQGFRDGIMGARNDFDNHRPWNVNNRDEYRHPHVPRGQRDAYRDGFQRGYERGEAHLTGQDQGPPPGFGRVPPPEMGHGPDGDRGPGMGPGMGPGGPGPQPGMGMGPGGDVRRHGFEEGIEGALRDLDNHRQADLDNRDEFRNPNVPFELRDAYRDGYRAGYARGMAALAGGPGDDDRFRGPGSDLRRRGFEDGAEGAIRDWDNHRNWDANGRDEYRHPVNIPREMWDMYQDSYRRGYERMSRELSGYQDRR